MANLDRLIRLIVRGPGMRVNGRYQDGPITFDGAVWAEQRITATKIEILATLFTTRGDRTYRIRHREDVVSAQVTNLKVVVGQIEYAVTEVEPYVKDRNRWLDLVLLTQEVA